jgi:hypothetical protein
MNAAGDLIPLMLIFKHSRINDMLKKRGFLKYSIWMLKNGWITLKLFVQWLEHFIKCTILEKRDQKQILLLLDAHGTYLYQKFRSNSAGCGIFFATLKSWQCNKTG